MTDEMRNVRKEICDAISEMLDNPKDGIYPTTRCYDRIEKFILAFQQPIKNDTSEGSDVDRNFSRCLDLKAEVKRLQEEINAKGGYKEMIQGLNFHIGTLKEEVKHLRDGLEWYALADGKRITIDSTVAKQLLTPTNTVKEELK